CACKGHTDNSFDPKCSESHRQRSLRFFASDGYPGQSHPVRRMFGSLIAVGALEDQIHTYETLVSHSRDDWTDFTDSLLASAFELGGISYRNRTLSDFSYEKGYADDPLVHRRTGSLVRPCPMGAWQPLASDYSCPFLHHGQSRHTTSPRQSAHRKKS